MKSKNKIILFFGFFVLPFLIGVALLFRGYNSLRNLTTLYPVEIVNADNPAKADTIYHVVGNLDLINIEGSQEEVAFSGKHVLVAKFSLGDLAYARKQLTYISYLLERHSGITVMFLFQGENFKDFLEKDDYSLLERRDRLKFYGYSNAVSEKVSKAFYPEGEIDEEYTLVDANGNIRVHFNIEDTRDVKKRVNILKLLDLEFPERKIKTVEQLRE